MGLTASLVVIDRDVVCCYRSYLKRFLACSDGDFQQHPESLLFLARTLANMVNIAAYSFHILGYPRYHEDFLTALHTLLQEESVSTAGKQDDAKQLLALLQEKYS